jgi:hypothetical protein
MTLTIEANVTGSNKNMGYNWSDFEADTSTERSLYSENVKARE